MERRVVIVVEPDGRIIRAADTGALVWAVVQAALAVAETVEVCDAVADGSAARLSAATPAAVQLSKLCGSAVSMY